MLAFVVHVLCVCVFLPVCAKGLHASVCTHVYTYVSPVLCLFASQLTTGERTCVYIERDPRTLFRSAYQISVRACIDISGRAGGVKSAAGGGGYSFCPGVTGPLQEECLGHMG